MLFARHQAPACRAVQSVSYFGGCKASLLPVRSQKPSWRINRSFTWRNCDSSKLAHLIFTTRLGCDWKMATERIEFSHLPPYRPAGGNLLSWFLPSRYIFSLASRRLLRHQKRSPGRWNGWQREREVKRERVQIPLRMGKFPLSQIELGRRCRWQRHSHTHTSVRSGERSQEVAFDFDTAINPWAHRSKARGSEKGIHRRTLGQRTSLYQRSVWMWVCVCVVSSYRRFSGWITRIIKWIFKLRPTYTRQRWRFLVTTACGKMRNRKG